MMGRDKEDMAVAHKVLASIIDEIQSTSMIEYTNYVVEESRSDQRSTTEENSSHRGHP